MRGAWAGQTCVKRLRTVSLEELAAARAESRRLIVFGYENYLSVSPNKRKDSVRATALANGVLWSGSGL